MALPTWDETVEATLPTWDETNAEDKDTKRAALQQEMEKVRRERKVGDFFQRAAEIGEVAIEPLTASGMMNQPFRAVGMADPYQAGKPLISLPKPTGTGMLSGIGQLAAQTVEGFTTPEMIVTGAAFPQSAVARALVAGEMASTLPESIMAGGEVLRDPNATPAQKVMGAGSPLVTAAFVRGIAKTPEWLPEVPAKPTPQIDQSIVNMEAALGIGVTPQHRLGIGPISASPFAQPGIPELADAALRERMQQVVVPGQEGAALAALRGAIEPQPSRITPVTIARADRPFTGDESVIQPTIAGLQAKPGFAKTASDVLLERKTPEVDQLIANAEAVLPAAAAEAKKGVTSASSITKATEVHGDVLPREEPSQVVPVEGSGSGIQPQATGGIPEAQGTVGATTGQERVLLGIGRQAQGEVLLTANEKTSIQQSPSQTENIITPTGTQRGNEVRGVIPTTQIIKAATWIERSPKESKLLTQLGESGVPLYRSIDDIPDAQNLRYHGTMAENVPSIVSDGLTSGMSHNYESVKGVGGIGDVTFAFKVPTKDTRLGVLSAGDVVHGEPVAVVINQTPASVKGPTIDYALRKSQETSSAPSEQPAVEGIPKGGTIESPAKPSPVAQETAPVAPAPEAALGESSKGVVEPTSTAPPPAISEATTKGEKLQLVNQPEQTKLQSGLPIPEFLEPPKSTVTPEQRAQLDKALGDVYTIFEPLPKEKVPTKKRAVNIIEGVRTGFSSKFRPLNKLAEDIAKSAGKTKSQDIAGIFEQLKGSSGKGEADIYRFDREVSDLVKGEEKDFNAYMFLRRSLDRLNQDLLDLQKEMADPGSVKDLNRRQVAEYTIPELESKLKSLTSILGPNKTVTFQKAADLYNRYMDDALRLQVTSGRMSPEVYSKIRSENQFYAPFKVMRWLNEEMKPEGTGKKIDTVADYTKAMRGIEDPNFRLGDMLSAARQNLLTSRILSDKALAMQKVAALAKDDPNGLFIRKLKWNEDAPDGWETVNVYEEGKKVKYATNPDVAHAVSIFSNTQATGLMARSIGAGASLFRAGATALNVPFQVSNLMADVPRAALVSKYGLRGVRDMIVYPLDFVHALYSAMAGDVFGVKNKLYLDFLDSGVAGSTIQSYLTPKALAFREPTAISGGKRAALNVLYSPAEFAQAIEQTSKILGVKRAMRFEGVKSGKELAAQIPEAITELRRFSGSPDFGRMGSTVETAKLNLLYMFLNARIQGAVADVGRLTGRDGAKVAATTWFRTMTAVGLPTAYLYFMNQMPGNKEDYDRLPQNTKRNYWPIPKPGKKYVTNEDGERVRDYWLIPKRESSKWIADMVESGLEFAQQRDSKAFFNFAQTMIEDISPVNIQGRTAQERIESVGSSLHPFIKAPVELATGRDTYRHQAIVKGGMEKASPEKQFTDRTAEAFKTLAVAMPDVAPEFLRSPVKLENLTRNLTAGLVTQFLPRKPVEGRKGIENLPLLQRFQSIPYTDQEAFRQQYTQLEREAADEYLDRNRAAQKLIEDNKGKSLPDVVRGAGKDVKLIKQVVDLWLAKKNGATSKDRQLINLPAKQRAEFLLKELKAMPKAQRNKAILDYSKKRVLTESVFQEMGAQAGEIFK